MKDDLISRSAAKKEMLSWAVVINKPHLLNKEDALHVLDTLPAVDAEEVFKHLHWVKEALEMAKQNLAPVVRCKNCRYIRPEVDAFTHEVVGHWCSQLDIGSVEYDHFCSWGERRADDATD